MKCFIHRYHCPICGSKSDLNKMARKHELIDNKEVSTKDIFICYYGHQWEEPIEKINILKIEEGLRR